MVKVEKNNRLAARLDDKTYQRLLDTAAAKGITISDTIRDFINDAPNEIMTELREVRRENLRLNQDITLIHNDLDQSISNIQKEQVARDKKLFEHLETLQGLILKEVEAKQKMFLKYLEIVHVDTE
jgi:antitoxin component of RelBE/YafQ-DinJ toxin-antitoxin module